MATHASMLSSILIERENIQNANSPKRPFRTKTLSLLQSNFKKREDLKKQDRAYHGLVAFIAGLYRVNNFDFKIKNIKIEYFSNFIFVECESSW